MHLLLEFRDRKERRKEIKEKRFSKIMDWKEDTELKIKKSEKKLEKLYGKVKFLDNYRGDLGDVLHILNLIEDDSRVMFDDDESYCISQAIKKVTAKLELLSEYSYNSYSTFFLIGQIKKIVEYERFVDLKKQSICSNNILQYFLLDPFVSHGYGLSRDLKNILKKHDFLSFNYLVLKNEVFNSTDKQWRSFILPNLSRERKEQLFEVLEQSLLKKLINRNKYYLGIRNSVKELFYKAKSTNFGEPKENDYQKIRAAEMILPIHPEKALAFVKPIEKKLISKKDGENVSESEFYQSYGSRLFDVFNIAGRAYDDLRKGDEAIDYYIKSLRASAKYSRVGVSSQEWENMYALANIFYRAKQYKNEIDIRLMIKGIHGKHRPSDIEISEFRKEDCAENLGSLSWTYLLTKQYDEAYESAAEGLKTDPSKIWIKTNLAHALLLSGKKERAETIYFVNAYQMLYPDKSFGTVVIDDFKRLKEHGISHPYMKVIEERINDIQNSQTKLKSLP